MKKGIVSGQELMQALLTAYNMYDPNALLIILQLQWIENQEERYCQWSGINASITDRRVFYTWSKCIADNFTIEKHWKWERKELSMVRNQDKYYTEARVSIWIM